MQIEQSYEEIAGMNQHHAWSFLTAAGCEVGWRLMKLALFTFTRDPPFSRFSPFIDNCWVIHGGKRAEKRGKVKVLLGGDLAHFCGVEEILVMKAFLICGIDSTFLPPSSLCVHCRWVLCGRTRA